MPAFVNIGMAFRKQCLNFNPSVVRNICRHFVAMETLMRRVPVSESMN